MDSDKQKENINIVTVSRGGRFGLDEYLKTKDGSTLRRLLEKPIDRDKLTQALLKLLIDEEDSPGRR